MDRSHAQTGQCFRQIINSNRFNKKECKHSHHERNPQQLQTHDNNCKTIILNKTLIKRTDEFSSSRNSSIHNNTNVTSNKGTLQIRRIPKEQSSRKTHEIIMDSLKQKNRILYDKYKITRRPSLSTTSKSTSVLNNISETKKEHTTEQLQKVENEIKLKTQTKLHSFNYYRKVNTVPIIGNRKGNGDETIKRSNDSLQEYLNRSTFVLKNPRRKVHMIVNNSSKFQQIKRRYFLINNRPNVSAHLNTSNVTVNSINEQNRKTITCVAGNNSTN